MLAFTNSLKQARIGQQQFADAVQQQFNAWLAVNLKYTLMLSREKFFRLRNLLSHQFDIKQVSTSFLPLEFVNDLFRINGSSSRSTR